MKKIGILTLVVVLSFGMNACKKPPLPRPSETENTGGSGGGAGEGEENKPSAFVGTWDYTEIVLENGSLSLMGNAVGTFTGFGTSIKGSVVMTENPNKYTTNLEFTADIDIAVFGQSQNQQLPVDPTSSSGTWTEDNGKITLTDDNGNQLAIVSSNENRIVFRGNFDQSISFGQQFALDANSDVEFTIEK